MENLENTKYNWTSFEGEKLFGQSWIPKQEVKAVINFVHGIGEHTDRYQEWMPFFTDAGFAVFAIEYRGHGRSFGKRGYIKNYDDILKDIDVLLQESKAKYPDLAHFIYGHSLGGNIVSNYILRRETSLKAAIITSPWFWLSKEPSAALMTVSKLLYKIAPGLTISSGLKTSDISQVKKVVEDYKKDELVHGKISLEMFFSAFNNGKWAVENADKLTIPVLLAHGTADHICSHKGSEAFYNKNPQKVHLKLWEDMYHELHNETIREEHAAYIINWIKENI